MLAAGKIWIPGKWVLEMGKHQKKHCRIPEPGAFKFSFSNPPLLNILLFEIALPLKVIKNFLLQMQ
jgi:hypothetical protein